MLRLDRPRCGEPDGRDLEPGARVYVEGRVKAEAYTPRDGGGPRVSLTVLCRVAQPMGRIGRRRPQTRDRAPAGAYQRPAPERRPEVEKPALAAVPDDDPLDDVHALEEIGR